MTNGGLETTRSNCAAADRMRAGCRRAGRAVAPANGPPSAAALSWALSRAIRRQRAEVSVAVTSAACVARWNACTPQPVPMSRARPTGGPRGPAGQGGRGTADAEDVVRPQGSPASGVGQVRGQPPLVVVRGVRRELQQRAHLVVGAGPRGLDQAQRLGSRRTGLGQRAVERRAGDRKAEQPEPGQDGQRLGRPVAGHPLGRQDLVAAERA